MNPFLPSAVNLALGSGLVGTSVLPLVIKVVYLGHVMWSVTYILNEVHFSTVRTSLSAGTYNVWYCIESVSLLSLFPQTGPIHTADQLTKFMCIHVPVGVHGLVYPLWITRFNYLRLQWHYIKDID